MFKLNSKAIFFIATLTVLCFMPETSWAAGGSIFDIISSKMIETVKDVRRIVYIVAGFGLIMFAVLAIFNKISFKHLSYICIGLFLLSVMMPFINYFSGANLTDPELNYGMLIDPDNPDIVGSEAGGENVEKRALEGVLGGDMADIEDKLKQQGLQGLADQLGVPELAGGADINESEPSDGTKIKKANGKFKCCKNGVNKSGTGCKVSLGDIVKAGKAAVGAAQDALKAAGNAKDFVEGAVGGVKDAFDAAASGKDFFDSVGKLAGSLGRTADDLGSSFNNALSASQDFTENLGDASRRVNGGNSSFADAVDNDDSKFNQWADKAKDTSAGVRDDVNSNIVEPGQDIGTMGDHLDGIKDSFNNFFN